MQYNTCVIFGVFDGVHDGHLALINEAKEKAYKLVVIVAPDEVVVRLKGNLPKHNESERLKFLNTILQVGEAVLGDKEDGVYDVLKRVNPDLIFLGYDQQDLFNDLNTKIKNGELEPIDIIFGKPYHPERFHSSILNK